VADSYYDFGRAVQFLKALVRIPSDNPPGECARHAEATAKLLTDLGFKVERHRVPDELVRANGMRSVTNLVVRERFGAGTGPVIALNAHGDVVPPGQGWTTDPYGASERNGAIYGRGAAVSKSDFATYTFALRTLKAQASELNGTVELHFTYDEEAGGDLGPKWLLEEKITRPDMAICAGFSYSIVTAHNGCLHLEVSVAGKQAHAAMPETGADALEAANAVLTALYAERKRLAKSKSRTPGIGSPKITVGLISGGINTNVVPDLVTLRLDRRLIPEENSRHVERDLIALIKRAGEKRKGITINIKRILLAEPLKPVKGIESMVEAIQRHARTELKQTIKATGVPLYTDARHYAAKRIPTVLYGAGPRSILEANAHRADEHVRLKDLEAAIKIVAGALRDLLGK
jgi:acetylornithine deacetylase/succinyl-diaminopimelate desuccinylase family protein